MASTRTLWFSYILQRSGSHLIRIERVGIITLRIGLGTRHGVPDTSCFQQRVRAGYVTSCVLSRLGRKTGAQGVKIRRVGLGRS